MSALSSILSIGITLTSQTDFPILSLSRSRSPIILKSLIPGNSVAVRLPIPYMAILLSFISANLLLKFSTSISYFDFNS